MSRVWTSSAIDTRCGKCGQHIGFGDPVQTITAHPDRKLKTRFVRCRLCGDHPPPASLPPPIVNRGTPVQPTALLRPDTAAQPALLFDFKTAAGHDRQPGEEG